MKIETMIFAIVGLFFLPVSIVYGFLTHWTEWVGVLALLLCFGLGIMISSYLMLTGRRVGLRPEDREDAEIHEGAGEQGHFSPWSWWPLVLGASAAISFLGVAVGWWILFIGAGLALVALVGWVFEYSRGDHEH